MIVKLWERLQTFQDHHQMICALLVAFGVICASWGIQKLLETFFFPQRPHGYVLAIILGLGLLWLTKHVIMHEF
jgi:hypothetical protein